MQPDQRSGDPVLTGLYGFRWPAPEMDAKCVHQDTNQGHAGPGAQKIDRHHRVIPDPDCSCGIHAGADELTVAREPLPPRRVPFVTGFVSLTGRVLHDGSIVRAQHATIIGPLSLALGRRPRWHGLAPAAAESLPARVTAERGTYRTLWTNRGLGEDATLWLEKTAKGLTQRYRSAVEIAM